MGTHKALGFACAKVARLGSRGVHDDVMRFAEAMTLPNNREHGMEHACRRPPMRLDDGRAVPDFLKAALLVTILQLARQSRMRSGTTRGWSSTPPAG